MRHFGFEPLIAGDDGDAQDFCIRRLDQEEDRLLIRSGGPCGILVDDDFAFGLGPG